MIKAVWVLLSVLALVACAGKKTSSERMISSSTAVNEMPQDPFLAELPLLLTQHMDAMNEEVKKGAQEYDAFNHQFNRIQLEAEVKKIAGRMGAQATFPYVEYDPDLEKVWGPCSSGKINHYVDTFDQSKKLVKIENTNGECSDSEAMKLVYKGDTYVLAATRSVTRKNIRELKLEGSKQLMCTHYPLSDEMIYEIFALKNSVKSFSKSETVAQPLESSEVQRNFAVCEGRSEPQVRLTQVLYHIAESRPELIKNLIPNAVEMKSFPKGSGIEDYLKTLKQLAKDYAAATAKGKTLRSYYGYGKYEDICKPQDMDCALHGDRPDRDILKNSLSIFLLKKYAEVIPSGTKIEHDRE